MILSSQGNGEIVVSRPDVEHAPIDVEYAPIDMEHAPIKGDDQVNDSRVVANDSLGGASIRDVKRSRTVKVWRPTVV